MIVFEKVRWKNFLSTGNVYSEVDLQRSRTNLIVGHNGSGKSTILDALTFSLFGRPFRKISKSMLVNSVNEKDTMVEIEFSIGNNKYTIVRGIKPNKFKVYCNGEPWDEDAKAVDQQKSLEQNVLKMNFKSFTQIVVLGSSTFVPFMRLPGQQRREIIEDILDIQVFSVMNGKLKDKIRENREEVKDLDYQVHLLEEKIELQKNYMMELQKKALAEVDKKKEKIQEYLKEEENSNEELNTLTLHIGKINEEMSDYAKSSDKLKKLNTILIKLKTKLNTCKKEHQFFEDNHVCPTCTQDLSDDFRDVMLKEGESKLEEMNDGYGELQTAIEAEEKRNEKFVTLSLEVNELNGQVSNTNYQLMTIRNGIKEIEEEIKEIEGATPDKKAEYNTVSYTHLTLPTIYSV